ncbi:hypothetical protein [Allomuricauda sp. SCSIO 65647]|uniref:hypothetical protein n=1 Tax=Allomuricauda sp. SCSIO 65647 TaxID=2908843 RepID=UPI001F3D3506|nr:hypothetical protein [Muricauda sp. SCSIO 65647]UJH69071.1 hypothetical protein L0P89_07615 [Muricauda sp. SCSIO 65647]
MRNKIVWSQSTELRWSDFLNSYNKQGLYAKVGLSARYNSDDPILFRSKTVFIPEESYASDTTDLINLRVAQAKFNLLEIYRRKMEKQVDELRKNKVDFYEPSDFEKMNERYYSMFEDEWQRFIDSENQMDYLEQIEKRIAQELY